MYFMKFPWSAVTDEKLDSKVSASFAQLFLLASLNNASVFDRCFPLALAWQSTPSSHTVVYYSPSGIKTHSPSQGAATGSCRSCNLHVPSNRWSAPSSFCLLGLWASWWHLWTCFALEYSKDLCEGLLFFPCEPLPLILHQQDKLTFCVLCLVPHAVTVLSLHFIVQNHLFTSKVIIEAVFPLPVPVWQEHEACVIHLSWSTKRPQHFQCQSIKSSFNIVKNPLTYLHMPMNIAASSLYSASSTDDTMLYACHFQQILH